MAKRGRKKGSKLNDAALRAQQEHREKWGGTTKRRDAGANYEPPDGANGLYHGMTFGPELRSSWGRYKGLYEDRTPSYRRRRT